MAKGNGSTRTNINQQVFIATNTSDTYVSTGNRTLVKEVVNAATMQSARNERDNRAWNKMKSFADEMNIKFQPGESIVKIDTYRTKGYETFRNVEIRRVGEREANEEYRFLAVIMYPKRNVSQEILNEYESLPQREFDSPKKAYNYAIKQIDKLNRKHNLK